MIDIAEHLRELGNAKVAVGDYGNIEFDAANRIEELEARVACLCGQTKSIEKMQGGSKVMHFKIAVHGTSPVEIDMPDKMTIDQWNQMMMVLRALEPKIVSAQEPLGPAILQLDD